METIYVICWNYSDRSNGGIVQAYTNEEDAQRMLELLEEQNEGLRKFSIESVYLID